MAERVALLRRLPAVQRIVALGAALEVCSREEAVLLAPELLELAVSPTFEAPSTAVRRIAFFSTRRRRERSEKLADEALRLIIARWSILPPQAREAAHAIGAGRWGRAIALDADTPGSEQFCREAALAITELGDLELVPLLARAILASPDSGGVADAAERAFLLLSARIAHDRLAPIMPGAALDIAGDPTTGRTAGRLADGSDAAVTLPRAVSGGHARLHAALAQAITSFPQHRRRGVLHAALFLLDPAVLRQQDPLVEWFRRGGGGTHAALVGLVRWSKTPLARLRAFEWLPREGWAQPAVDRLAKAATLGEHAAVIASAHLVERPARAQRLAAVKIRADRGGSTPSIPANAAVPPPALLLAMGPSLRRMAPRFIAATGCDLATRKLALEPLLADPEPMVRHASVRGTTPAGLAEFCLDGDVAIARSAYAAWSAGGTLTSARRERPAAEQHRQRLVRHLAVSPHPTVRAWASQDIESAPAADWDTCNPETVAGRLAARRALAADAPAFTDRMIDLVTSGDPARRLSMLMLARRLTIINLIEEQVRAIAADATLDARLVASAVAALGEAGLVSPDELTRTGLPHSDARVRANTVEAIERAGNHETPPAAILELKHDPHHRVRANALRAVIRCSDPAVEPRVAGSAAADAAESLASMLGDDRSMHRLAGAWLAARCTGPAARGVLGERWAEMLARVEELARHDDDARVRRRAAEAAGVMMRSVRSRWTASRTDSEGAQ